MSPIEKSALIRMDMRGPSRAADCFDCVVAFPAAVEQMRANDDEYDFSHTMITGTRVAFQSLDSAGLDGLSFVAAAAQDLLYRYLGELTVMDRYTRAYCSLVIRDFFQRLSAHRLRTFYILDNTLRDDRFAALLELFELSGIATTIPRRDGTSCLRGFAPAWTQSDTLPISNPMHRLTISTPHRNLLVESLVSRPSGTFRRMIHNIRSSPLRRRRDDNETNVTS
jgi:hypothetical protein